MLLGVLLAFTVLAATLKQSAAVTSVPMVQTDAHMGIITYSFLVSTPDLQHAVYELRVYMRATCDSSGQQVRLRGFAGAFPIEDAAPKISGPHFQLPALRQHKLQVVSTATNRTADLKWFGPSNQGLWRFEANVEPSGGEVLALEGSLHTHQLLLTCGESSAVVGPGQRSPLPSEGLWNVMTTTSANNISPKTLGYLLMLHVQYHARLGFNGTILRCNKGEAQELSLLPHIEALVATNKLIIWPWVSQSWAYTEGHINC